MAGTFGAMFLQLRIVEVHHLLLLFVSFYLPLASPLTSRKAPPYSAGREPIFHYSYIMDI